MKLNYKRLEDGDFELTIAAESPKEQRDLRDAVWAAKRRGAILSPDAVVKELSHLGYELQPHVTVRKRQTPGRVRGGDGVR